MVGNRIRYLAICEGDPGTQRLMDLFAIRLGFKAYIKRTCVELMTELEAEHIIPEVVFLQPSNRFNEAFSELHRNPAYEDYRDLPIVAITTDPREQHFRDLCALGISAILLKPFGFQELKQVVERLCAEG